MSDYDRARLLTPLACWLTYLCAIALHLDAPWWAAASAWMIANPDFTKLFRKGLFRLLGTVIGCVIGYAVALIFGSSVLPMLVVMWGIGVITLYKRYTSPYGYAWLLAGATVAIVIFEALLGNDDLRRLALARGSELSLGVIVSTLVAASFAPKIEEAGPIKTPVIEDLAPIRETAFRAATILVVAALLLRYYNIPSPVQAAITAYALSAPIMPGSHQRVIDRCIGCGVGGALGLFVISLSVESFLLWTALYVAGLYLAAGPHLSGLPHAYIGTQAGYAWTVMMVTGPGAPDSIEPVASRFAGIMIGVVLIVLADFFSRARPVAAPE